MISDRGLAALRAAATLVHAVPGLRARVRHDADVVLEVGRGLVAEPGAAHRTMEPCAFRCAVVRAVEQRRAGRRMAFLDLPEGVDPAVDVGTPTGGSSRPGGLYRVPSEGAQLWALATSLAPERAHQLGRPLVDAAGPLDGLVAMGLRSDVATDVAIAYVRTTCEPGSAGETAVVELLESMLATWTAHELMDSVAVGSHG